MLCVVDVRRWLLLVVGHCSSLALLRVVVRCCWLVLSVVGGTRLVCCCWLMNKCNIELRIVARLFDFDLVQCHQELYTHVYKPPCVSLAVP